MTRYFFHFYADTAQYDHEGIELASDEDAWVQGVQCAGTMLHDAARNLRPGQPYRLECIDDRAETVFFVSFEATKAR